MIRPFVNAFAALLKGAIRVYGLLLSPVLAGNCRYYPTCSRYAVQAIDRHGPGLGSWLALKRILRCNPWAGCGADPVPGGDGGQC